MNDPVNKPATAAPKRKVVFAAGIHSLSKRFHFIVAIILLTTLVGSVFIYLQFVAANDMINESKAINDRMHLLHLAESVSRQMLDRERYQTRSAEKAQKIPHDLKREFEEIYRRARLSLTARELSLVEQLYATFEDPPRSGDLSEMLIQKISEIHHHLDDLTNAQYGKFSKGMGTLNISLLVLIVLASGTVIVPAVFMARDIVAGLQQLMQKITAIQDGGDPRETIVERKDEIGAIGRAIDRMHISAQAREIEATINRQLMNEQQKMNSIISLAGGIAHEVANPLASLVARLESHQAMWQENSGGTTISKSELNENFIEMQDAVRRIGKVIQEITAFPDDDEQEFETIDINDLIARIVGMMRLHDRTRNIDFNVNLSQDTPAIAAPRGKVTLALYSLIGAAIEYLTDQMGEIFIDTFPADISSGLEVRIMTRDAASKGQEATGADVVQFDASTIQADQTVRSAHRILGELNGSLEVNCPAYGNIVFNVSLSTAEKSGLATPVSRSD